MDNQSQGRETNNVIPYAKTARHAQELVSMGYLDYDAFLHHHWLKLFRNPFNNIVFTSPSMEAVKTGKPASSVRKWWAQLRSIGWISYGDANGKKRPFPVVVYDGDFETLVTGPAVTQNSLAVHDVNQIINPDSSPKIEIVNVNAGVRALKKGTFSPENVRPAPGKSENRPSPEQVHAEKSVVASDGEIPYKYPEPEKEKEPEPDSRSRSFLPLQTKDKELSELDKRALLIWDEEFIQDELWMEMNEDEKLNLVVSFENEETTYLGQQADIDKAELDSVNEDYQFPIPCPVCENSLSYKRGRVNCTDCDWSFGYRVFKKRLMPELDDDNSFPADVAAKNRGDLSRLLGDVTVKDSSDVVETGNNQSVKRSMEETLRRLRRMDLSAGITYKEDS